jgi:hypothetical protein
MLPHLPIAVLVIISLVQPRLDTVKVPVRNVTPARVLNALNAQRGLVPPGVTVGIVAGDADVLTVKGTPSDVKRIEELIRLLDVRPRMGFIELSYKRVTRDSNSVTTVEDLVSQRIAITNGCPVRCTIKGGAEIQLDFTPRFNGDGSITLIGKASMGESGLDAPAVPFDPADIRIARRIESGKMARIAANTNVFSIRDQVRAGEVLESRSPGVILYIEAAVPR